MIGAADVRADDLTIFFHTRPPYSWRDEGGRLHGLVAEPAEQALAAAAIPYKWEELPSARQLETIKIGQVIACGLGWFKRPEREKFAHFSAPVYRDKRMLIIARENDTRFAGTPPISVLFGRKDLTLLTKVAYSYGAYMDGKLKALTPTRQETSTDNLHMLDMIALGRADYMLMSAEEADYVLASAGDTAKALTAYPFLDAPEGEARYLMCAKRVPQEWLDRFNAALTDR